MANEYASVTELKTWLGISGSDQDASLAIVAAAASRAIDQYCQRRFYADGSATARYYTARGGLVETDDISTTTGLVVKYDGDADRTYETTLAADDPTTTGYQLEPLNADTIHEGQPWWLIRGIGATSFPSHVGGVEVTADWGWPAIPTPIKQAALVHSASLWVNSGMLQDTEGSPGVQSLSLNGSDSVTFGSLAGIAQAFGGMVGLSPVVKGLVEPFKRIPRVR